MHGSYLQAIILLILLHQWVGSVVTVKLPLPLNITPAPQHERSY